MTFHDICTHPKPPSRTPPSPVIPTEQSERRDPGSILDVQNPEVGDEIPPLRPGFPIGAPVGMTIMGKRCEPEAS